MRRNGRLLLGVVLFLVMATAAHGQEAILTRSAMQPPPGTLSFREQLRFQRYGADPTRGLQRVDEFTAMTMLSYGVTADLAVEARLPLSYRSWKVPVFDESFDETTVDEMTFLLKWRLWRDDYGPTNTARLSLFGGLQTPMFGDGFAEGGWNPLLGAVFMQVHDRHGWNIAGMYEMTTRQAGLPLHPGSTLADAFFLDGAYLFRIAPEDYSADTSGAWYAVAELNSVVETNGDREMLFAPGVLYEGPDLALEANLQFPVYHHLRYRPEREWSFVVGVRLLF
jgi:hypothetical protein